jgi:hypothetical protein
MCLYALGYTVNEINYMCLNLMYLAGNLSTFFHVDGPEVPRFPDRLPNDSDFSPSFLAVKYRWAHFMDVLCHLLLERADKTIENAG